MNKLAGMFLAANPACGNQRRCLQDEESLQCIRQQRSALPAWLVQRLLQEDRRFNQLLLPQPPAKSSLRHDLSVTLSTVPQID